MQTLLFLHRPHSPSQTPGLRIEYLTVHSKGFVCSGSNGSLYVFEKTDDSNVFHEVRSVNISEDLNTTETIGTGKHQWHNTCTTHYT